MGQFNTQHGENGPQRNGGQSQEVGFHTDEAYRNLPHCNAAVSSRFAGLFASLASHGGGER